MGSPSRHQFLIQWKSHGPAKPMEGPQNAPGEHFPFPLPHNPPGTCPRPWGVRGVQERRVFIASGSC